MYKSYSLFETIYRFVAIIISPPLLKFNPNFISFLSLIFAIFGLYLFLENNLIFNMVILFFIISFVLDYSDGLVARYNNMSSFFGRFIDGLFDILVIGLLHIFFIILLLDQNNSPLYKILYFLIVLLLPIQHLILDRFSALARWCNETKKNKIQPYFRNFIFKKVTFLLLDSQHFCIWFLLIFGLNNNYIFIETYLVVSLLSSFFNIILYIYLAKKNFSNHSNKEDNVK